MNSKKSIEHSAFFDEFQVPDYAVSQLMRSLITAFKSGEFESKSIECPPIDSSDVQLTDMQPNAFERMLREKIVPNSRVMTLRNDYSVEFVFNVSVVGDQSDVMESAQANTNPIEIATIANDNKVMKLDKSTWKPLRKYFRIGVAEVKCHQLHT